MILPSLLLSLSLLAPASPQVALPGADDAVVRSEDGDLTRGQLAEWLLSMRGEVFASAFVDGWLYAREARRLGLPDVTEEAKAVVDAEIQERIDRAYGGNADGWLKELKEARRTPEGRRLERLQEVIRDLDLRNIASHDRVVPQEKVVRDWEREYGVEGRRYRVRLLFRRLIMPPMPGLTRAEQIELRDRVRAEKAEEMRAIRARALAGEPFPGLVRDLSEDPATRASGGRPEGGFMKTLGWQQSDLDSIAALPPGGISEPIFVQGGFWLVQLEELVVTPLASVEAELRARLAAKGPESDELAAVAERLHENVTYETLPALHEHAKPGTKLPLETPVMRIDGQDVSRGEYAAFLLANEGDVSAIRFAEETHIERLAAAAKVEPAPEEIEAAVESTVQNLVDLFHKGNRAEWEAETARVRGSVEGWFRDARQQARLDRLLAGLYKRERVVTDELVRQTWRARYGEGGRSLHMRVIRIDTVLPLFEEGISPEEAKRLSAAAIEEARSLATEVAQRAKDGEDFAELAKRYSMDEETREAGGELPLGYNYHALPPEAVAVIDTMKPGAVAGAVESGLSHFVLELLAVREVPFEEVAADIRKELEDAEPTNLETRGYYNVTTRKMNIEVLPALFR